MSEQQLISADLETLLQANPDISAQRERTGTIWVTQNLHNGKDRVMTVYPLYEKRGQVEPAVAIEVREMDQNIRTRKYSNERPEIILKPNQDDTVTITVDETYGKLDSAIDPQDVIRNARIGLNLLQAVGSLPKDDLKRRQCAGRVNDEIQSQEEIMEDLKSSTPRVASLYQEIEGSQGVPKIKFVQYATTLLGKMPPPSTIQTLKK